MKLNKYKLGDLIEQRREKNKGYNYPIKGVSKNGFINPKQKEADIGLYNVFYKFDFVFNPARMEINSIALNTELEKGICSSLYEIFYVKRKELVLPEYLNLFIKRNEFARQCEFIGWGSAREYCRVSDISEIYIELPDIKIQQKYVDIYNSMVENQKSYEKGLDDLKLVCDSFIENLRRKEDLKELEKYIIRYDERNKDNKIKNVKGVSTSKKFREPTSKVNRNELSSYKIVHSGDISFVQTTHNEKVFANAINNTNEDIVVTSVNEVFKTNKEYLLPEYLVMFFNRTEFDRYARFHSWGSARETFTWNDLIKVKIPIPKLEIQQDIVNIYDSYITRQEINEKLKNKIKELCTILIKGSIEEAKLS